MSRKVKIGLIGLGNIGAGTHIKCLTSMENVELVGVCDIVREKADRVAHQCHTTPYYSHTELFDKSGLEAAIIAVPHYDHTTISVDAFDRGLHVLTEKPLAVHVNDAKKSIAAYERAKKKNPAVVFGIMFQERTFPHYKKLKDILDSGELGKLTRVTWINTTMFRTQAYYDMGGWRATWAGEGGGILTNQCPHTLDMYQWLFGVPCRITGHASLAKYHNIEVEDEVTACFEHENGMIGHLIVSTAEFPGTNRMEIVGENGKIIYENEKIMYYKNKVSMLKFSRESSVGFGRIENRCTEIPYEEKPSGHKIVTEKFVNAILNGGGELIAHGTEGINSVAIANAIMLSSFRKTTVDDIFNGDAFEDKLKELIRTSKFVKNVNTNVRVDINQSFAR